MAKQNFLAGGFYGKLGATVGQRWRNKRTLRVYVKTPNPNTPAQQANRGAFARAIKASQEAMVFNKGTQAFYTEGLTEFQYRTSTAKQRIDAGLTGFAVLPLFPDSYTPSVTVTSLSRSVAQGGAVRVSSVSLPVSSEPRELIISVTLRSTATGEYEPWRFRVRLATSGDWLFEFTPPAGYAPGEESRIYGVSCDDAQYDDRMVYIPEQSLGEASGITLDDFTVSGYENQYALLSSEKISQLAQPLQMVLRGSALDGLTLSPVAFENVAVYEPSKDEYVRLYLKDPLVLASGAQVTGGEITTQVSGYSVTVGKSPAFTGTEERWWVGEEASAVEIEYMSTKDAGGNSSINIISDYGQGIANIYSLSCSYPYRDSAGTHTGTVRKAASAETWGTSGLSFEYELDVTEDYPERSGDSITVEHCGVGGPLFFYGKKDFSLNMY